MRRLKISDPDPEQGFDSLSVVAEYAALSEITPAEAALFDRWIRPGMRILDLGVGTGRTTRVLAAEAAEYVGSDVSPRMVAKAQERFPGLRFAVHDAADLSAFEDESFDAVVFSYNGLDYLHPLERRQLAIQEARRVLRPAGIFIFSTHNSRAIAKRVRATGDIRSLVRQTAVAAYGTFRAVRALVPSRVFWSGSGYQVDRIKPLLTYYTTLKQLDDELERGGLTVVERLPGDHPARVSSFRTPWFYVAAQK